MSIINSSPIEAIGFGGKNVMISVLANFVSRRKFNARYTEKILRTRIQQKTWRTKNTNISIHERDTDFNLKIDLTSNIQKNIEITLLKTETGFQC